MTVKEIMIKLQSLSQEQTKKTYLRHGATEPLFGVKMGDLKPLQKKIKKNHELALELYATGNSDAMYLAGLIADETKVTPSELNRWVHEATWSMIAHSAVGGLAAESPHAVAVATKWIEMKKELIASSGWSTLAGYLSIAPNTEIDHSLFQQLLDRVVREIHQERNEVKQTMNGFLISLGSYLPEMTQEAKAAAQKIGKVTVDHGETGCKTPSAIDYLEKIEKMGRIGKKRKSVRC